MKKPTRPFKVRTEGATPVQKWINLVNKWNSCAAQPDNPYSRARMIFTKAEVNDLLAAYPLLKETILLINELDTYQIEALQYADYPMMEDFPTNCPKPVIIEGFTLID